MLQIRQYLLDNRYIHPKSPHTSTPGLWRKLHTLYDLESLDEREDARQLSDLSDSDSDSAADADAPDADLYSLADNKIHTQPFSLPEDDEFIEDLAWKRRFPGDKERRDASESPAALPEVNMDREAPLGYVRALRASAPSEEPAGELEVEDTPPATAKRGRGRPKGSTSAKAGAQAPVANRRRSTRQAAEQEDEDEDGDEEEDEEGESGEESGEDEDEEGGDEDEDEDQDDEQSSEEEEEEGSEDNTPAPKSSRSGRTRGRPARGASNARGRGRKK